MAINLQALGAIASALVVAACTVGNVKPTVQATADSHNPPCVPQTGSRIPAENPDLVATCYTSTDISRTGVPNAAQAVQILDPRVQVGH